MLTVTKTARTETLAPAAFAFAGFVLTTAALFMVPAMIIQPFKHQSERGLLLAIAIRHNAPLLTVFTGLASISLAALLWRRIKLWAKALVVLGVCLALAAATMARIDYFEWMFHPVPAAGFEAAASSKISASEMVMAVAFHGDSRAYPISMMAYHHILNDVVGGVPIAVTY